MDHKKLRLLWFVPLLFIFGGTYYFFSYFSKKEVDSGSKLIEFVQDKDIEKKTEAIKENINVNENINKKIEIKSKHGYEFYYSPTEVKVFQDDVSGLLMVCDLNAPDDIKTVYNSISDFGCLEFNSVTTNQDFDSFIDLTTANEFTYGVEAITGVNKGEKYILKTKEKIKLGDLDFYKVVYYAGEKGGVYKYSGLLVIEKNKIINATYFYNDYSIRNEKVIPIFEEILSTLKKID